MASMFSQVAKSTSQATKQTASTVARAAVNQTNETLQTAKAQVGLPSSEKPNTIESRQEIPQVVQEVQQHGPTEMDRQAIAAKEQSMLAQLEGRLSQIRAQKAQELSAYREVTQASMDSHTQSAPVEAPQPQGKLRKAVGHAKKAVTSLISSRKQGETKAGSGKG